MPAVLAPDAPPLVTPKDLSLPPSAALLPDKITLEEYLRREERALTKSEFIDGRILPMAGGTPRHNMVSCDIGRAAGNRLEAAGGTCDVHNSDQKVRAGDAGPFFYPDVTIVCGEPVFDSANCLRNPFAVFEVSSPSTTAYDHGEKFRRYRRFETLRHYVLVAINRVRVEHYERLPSGVWGLVGEHDERTDTLTFSDLPGVVFPLAEMYRRVQFDLPDAEIAAQLDALLLAEIQATEAAEHGRS